VRIVRVSSPVSHTRSCVFESHTPACMCA
jgi:hypothetical protein